MARGGGMGDPAHMLGGLYIVNYAWLSENFLNVDLTLAWPASIQYVSAVCQCFCGSSAVPSKEFSSRYVLYTFILFFLLVTCFLKGQCHYENFFQSLLTSIID